jgi:hypothetical protein
MSATPKGEFEKGQAAVEGALPRACEDTEPAAGKTAEARVEEILRCRRAELTAIERRVKAAEEKAQRHYEAEQRLAAEIRRHVAFLAGIGSAEREAPEQIEAAKTLMAALSAGMIALHGFEHAPIPQAARRWTLAQQMSAQMAEAIAAFLAPRVDADLHADPLSANHPRTDATGQPAPQGRAGPPSAPGHRPVASRT